MGRLSIRAAMGIGHEADLAPGAEALPFDVYKRGSKARAVVLLVLGGAVQYGAGSTFLAAHPQVPWHVWGWAAVLAGAGLGAELLAVREIVRFERWSFTRQNVTRKWRDLWGRGEWTEPLCLYKGVLSTQEVHARWQATLPYTLYTFALHHALRGDRSVRLYASRSSEGLHARRKRYALLFGLPALTVTAVGVGRPGPEDLGKSVRQRVAEESLKVASDATAAPPGDRPIVRVEGSQLVMLARGRLSPQKKVVAVVMVSAAVGMSVLPVPGGPPPLDWSRVLVVLLWLFSAVSTLELFEDILWEDVLIVSSQEVRAWRQFMRVHFRQVRMPADEVEEVLIQSVPGTEDMTAVQVITDKATVHFGRGLSLAQKEWVRDCIIAVISK